MIVFYLLGSLKGIPSVQCMDIKHTSKDLTLALLFPWERQLSLQGDSEKKPNLVFTVALKGSPGDCFVKHWKKAVIALYDLLIEKMDEAWGGTRGPGTCPMSGVISSRAGAAALSHSWGPLLGEVGHAALGKVKRAVWPRNP